MISRIENYLKSFLIWRIKNIPDKTFIILASAFTGLISGLAAVILKNAVHLIKSLLTSDFIKHLNNLPYFLYPVIGIFITVLVIRFVIKRQVAHGVPNTLYAISRQNGIIAGYNTWASVVTSSITVGFGGSVGLEGPAVATGAAIGSNVGRLLRQNYKNTILLIGCAAAGAMAAIFNSPLASLIFAVEVIMLDLTMSSLVPLLLATVTASLTSYLFFGNETLFHYPVKDPFLLKNFPWYLALGLFAGFASVYFSKLYMLIITRFSKIPETWKRIAIGGLILGILIFLFPSLFGEGYSSVNSLLAENYKAIIEDTIFKSFTSEPLIILAVFLAIILLKVFATAVTFGAGGIGGIFAPSLFLGANLGFFAGFALNIAGFTDVSISNFVLAGMCGTMAGILHAPLTAIFLIAEVTGSYQLFIPLMITSAISFLTVKYFQKHSVYTLQLAQSGDLITHHKDKAVLTLLKLEKVVEKNFIPVYPDDTLRSLVKNIKKSVRNIFPVIDKDQNFLGLIPLDNIRNVMFETELYDKVRVEELVVQPPVVLQLSDSMEDVMVKFKETGLWNLPVVDKGKYLGFVSRANLFNAYRSLLIEVSED